MSLDILADQEPEMLADWRYEVANGDTRLGLSEWLAHQVELRGPQRVEVYLWKRTGDGYLGKVRAKTVSEVYDELRVHLGEYPDGGEEYFSVSVSTRSDREWPDGDIVCFSVNGSSEGDYVHCQVHYNGHHELIFLGKTFMGRDASWAFARRLADLLEIQ